MEVEAAAVGFYHYDDLWVLSSLLSLSSFRCCLAFESSSMTTLLAGGLGGGGGDNGLVIKFSLHFQ